MSVPPKLGIIAGGGSAPRQLIEACRTLGRSFFVVCLKDQAEADLAEGLPHVWLSVGAIGSFKELVKREGIEEIVMIGRVRRPSLLEMKPDGLTLKLLTKIGMTMLGDDALLTAVGKALEEETGARVVGAHEIFAALLTPVGVVTRVAPDEIAKADIEKGVQLAREIGRLDIGQAVVVQQGLVLGVEAIEGTDALIERSAAQARAGVGGVLVKCAKPQQDRRFDLPSIGPETVAKAAQAGLRGIAVEAGQSLLLERDKTIAAADEAGLFLVGWESS